MRVDVDVEIVDNLCILSTIRVFLLTAMYTNQIQPKCCLAYKFLGCTLIQNIALAF